MKEVTNAVSPHASWLLAFATLTALEVAAEAPEVDLSPASPSYLARHAQAFPGSPEVLDCVLEGASMGTGQIEALLEVGAAAQGPLVVDVGATWCGPCRHSWPAFKEAARKHPQLTFVTMSVDQALPGARAVRDYIAREWNGGRSFGLPAYVAIRPDGTSCDDALHLILEPAIVAAAKCATTSPAVADTERPAGSARGRLAAAMGEATVALEFETVGEILDAIAHAAAVRFVSTEAVRNIPVQARAARMNATGALEITTGLTGLVADVVIEEATGRHVIVVWQPAPVDEPATKRTDGVSSPVSNGLPPAE